MKKIYIPIIVSTMAISLFFAACGTKNNIPNTTTSTTSRTTTTSTSTTTTTTSKTETNGGNMLEEGMSDVSSGLSEAGSEIKSDISKMR